MRSRRITGRQVREAAAEIEMSTGTVVHAFTTGAMSRCFYSLLKLYLLNLVSITNRTKSNELRKMVSIFKLIPEGKK